MSPFLWCLSACPGSPVCCAESEDSIYEKFNSVNSFAATRLYYPFFCLPCYFLIVTLCTAHCHFNRVQVRALPTEQAAPVLTDSFSRGYDPYTHACKARPLTTVGRTSLRCHHLVHRVGPGVNPTGRRSATACSPV